MDKIERLLLLYTKLITGEQVNKTLFCFEYECSPRTFERDIEAIRLYLSDSFSFSELRYDRVQNVYYIAGTKRTFLEPTEYLLLEHLLYDSAVLRKDEFAILLQHLLENTERGKRLNAEKEMICSTYRSPVHNKALLKMHGDLTNMIREQKCIDINYEEQNTYELIPCEIAFDHEYLYLNGFEVESKEMARYRVDKIVSFEILRSQNSKERTMVKEYMDHRSGK